MRGTAEELPGRDRVRAVFPVIAHTHSERFCSITGGYVVRDRALPRLFGRYGEDARGRVEVVSLDGPVYRLAAGR